MDTVEIELIGGPADGQRQTIQGDPMDPPHTVQLQQPQAIAWDTAEQTPDAPIQVRKLTYRRVLSRRDEGVLWQYHYDPHYR